MSCSFKQFGWVPGSILTGPPRKVSRARSDGLCPDTARFVFFAGQEERWTRRGQSAAAHARVEGSPDGTWDASWGRGLERPERAATTPGPRGPSRRHRGGQGLAKKSRPTGHERPSMARWTKSMRARSRTQCPAVVAKPGQLNAPKTVPAVPHLTFELARSAKLLEGTRHQLYKNLEIL